MKNATRYCTLALLITGYYSTDVYCSKQTGSSSTKSHHPSFLRFWNWAEETVSATKICGGAENVVKTETQQTFVNGLLVLLLSIYTPLEARVYYSQ